MYEAVVALMITIITLGILQQSLQIMRNIQTTSFRDQLRWHVTQEKLQRLIGPAKIRRFDKTSLIFEVAGKEEVVKKLEVIGNKGNQILNFKDAATEEKEPIMTNLKQIKIEKSQNLVIITTVNKADEKSEMYLTNDS